MKEQYEIIVLKEKALTNRKKKFLKFYMSFFNYFFKNMKKSFDLIIMVFYVVLFFVESFFLFDNFFGNIIAFSTIMKFFFFLLLCFYLYSIAILNFIDKLFTFFYLFFILAFILLIAFFFFLLFQIIFGIFVGKAFFALIFYEIVQSQRSTHFKFNTKIDIITETPNLFRCKLAAGIYASIYFCYKMISVCVLIPYLFSVKSLLFLGFCGTAYICFCEISNYMGYKYDFESHVPIEVFLLWGFNFCLMNLQFTASLIMTIIRITVQLIYELLSLRYALPGGVLLCGGPGMISPSGDSDDETPPFEGLTPAESKKLEKELRNNSPVVVEAYRPPEIILDLLPENPKDLKDIPQYVEAVIKNIEVFKEMSEEKYNKYQRDYLRRRENSELKIFCAVVPENFCEFLSCITPMIAGSINEKGEVFAVAIPVDGEKPVDFIIEGKGIQTKMTKNFSSGDLMGQQQKYKEIIEDENLNFRVQTVYTNLDRPDRMQYFLENDKDALKGQEAVRRQTFPNPTLERIREYFDFAVKNSEKVEETKMKIQQEGYLKAIAKPEKEPQIEEIITSRQGHPPFRRLVRKAAKTVLK